MVRSNVRKLSESVLDTRDGSAEKRPTFLTSTRLSLTVRLTCSMTVATAERLLGGGERSLRALVTSLVLEEITEAEWRTLDPDGATLRDVDRPEDLGPLS